MTGQFSMDGLSPSMWLRRANGSRLVSSKTAIELVRMIVRDEYGQDELDRNEPLSVQEDGDSWVVAGAPGEQHALGPGRFKGAGPVYARIARFDGQISDYRFLTDYDAGSDPKTPSRGNDDDAPKT
jgi:hypothetical protein